MLRIAAGPVAAHMVDLVACRYLIQIVVGSVNEPVEHLRLSGSLSSGAPSFAEIPVLIVLMREADHATIFGGDEKHRLRLMGQ